EQIISWALILAKAGAQSILLFDFLPAGVAAGAFFPGFGVLFLLVPRVVIIAVIVAAVVVVAFVLRHIDVVEDDADEVAADLFNHLFGADVHRLRVAAVLNDLDDHINL